MTSPRYPEIEVRLASDKPLALIGATREALRRAGVPRSEIHDFSSRAFASDDPYGVCRQWVRIVVRASAYATRKSITTRGDAT